MVLQNFVSVSKTTEVSCSNFCPENLKKIILYQHSVWAKVEPRAGISKSFCFDSFQHCLEIPYLSKYEQISPCSLIALWRIRHLPFMCGGLIDTAGKINDIDAGWKATLDGSLSPLVKTPLNLVQHRIDVNHFFSLGQQDLL